MRPRLRGAARIPQLHGQANALTGSFPRQSFGGTDQGGTDSMAAHRLGPSVSAHFMVLLESRDAVDLDVKFARPGKDIDKSASRRVR
jgi:hypothetical protein